MSAPRSGGVLSAVDRLLAATFGKTARRMNFNKLSTKIVGILVVFFLVAFSAICLMLIISWQLEGGGAAINDAGSQRMRTYRIAYLLSQQSISDRDNAVLRRDITNEMAVFERVLTGLERGDPERPLFLPKTSGIEQLVRQMRGEWNGSVKPQVERLLKMENGAERTAELVRFRDSVEQFVTLVNRLTFEIEASSTHSTVVARALHNGLIVLALVGTITLVVYFFAMVIRPVEEMRGGIKRMADADFSVRVPIRRNDEFGELGAGFNRMADRLDDLYSRLEQRVEEKTRDIAEKHRELTLLYEVAAFLNQPATIEAACRGVLDQVVALLDAQAGLVRFVDDTDKQLQLRIMVHRGLSDEFVRREASLALGECLCGTAAADGVALSRPLSAWPHAPARINCRGEGFAALVAIPIRSANRVLGIFNLFFNVPRTLKDNEVRLLETVGQHLGVAIENQRLVAREKEMAVSEERNLLAQELHDSIAQSLSFINIQAQMLEDSLKREDMAGADTELARIREGIQESYDYVRELLVHFRTRVDAGNLDIDVAIVSALEKFEGQTGIATTFAQQGHSCEIPPQNAIQILHIVQETLSNVRKHAGATRVEVAIERGAQCAIRVSDNGRGFDPAAPQSDAHVGLKIMRERAHRIGGRLDIQSRPGAGTTVALILPGERG